MRAIVQRVTRARVSVDDAVAGDIGPGFCILLGIGPADTADTARRFARRIAGLRICADGDGRMNLDLLQTGGAALVVSQFTLYADTSRGHRPGFAAAAPPSLAAHLCGVFIEALAGLGIPVAAGQFGANMLVDLVNDGPVTIVLTSGEDAWVADSG